MCVCWVGLIFNKIALYSRWYLSVVGQFATRTDHGTWTRLRTQVCNCTGVPLGSWWVGQTPDHGGLGWMHGNQSSNSEREPAFLTSQYEVVAADRSEPDVVPDEQVVHQHLNPHPHPYARPHSHPYSSCCLPSSEWGSSAKWTPFFESRFVTGWKKVLSWESFAMRCRVSHTILGTDAGLAHFQGSNSRDSNLEQSTETRPRIYASSGHHQHRQHRHLHSSLIAGCETGGEKIYPDCQLHVQRHWTRCCCCCCCCCRRQADLQWHWV